MTATLCTAKGEEILIDDQDFEFLSQYSWYAHSNSHGPSYPRTSIHGRGVFMHRLMYPEQMTDHINGNGMDNRRQNLRPCTRSTNGANRPKTTKPKSSVWKGVSYNPDTENWKVQVRKEGRLYYFKLHDDEADAATIYNFAAADLFGEFANYNEAPQTGLVLGDSE